jgi:type IV pilus assembly protein PilW
MRPSRHIRFAAPARMGGMSLMEILVAMAIGLIGVVVITQTYLVNENYKRSTVSAGGAQTNGALALFTIERDARMGGWGISWASALGCTNIQWHYDGVYSNPPDPGGTLPALTVAPVVITDGGAGPDTIQVMYGTGSERVMPASLTKTMPSPSAELEIDNPQGFSDDPGDLLLLVQGGSCSMTQVTHVQPAAGKIQHNPGVSAPYNPPGGGSLLPAYTAGAQVFNFGRPIVNIYSLALNAGGEPSALQLTSLFTAPSSTVVASYTPTPYTIVEHIVDLQAEYGKDNGVDNGTVEQAIYVPDDGTVDSYDNVTPATGLDWQRVLSVRIGVLARSEHYVKPESPGGPCTATTVAPSWSGGAFNVPGGLPSCYGYRVFETVVPIRNMIWRQG